MISPDELLTVRFPDLKESQVIFPGTTKCISKRIFIYSLKSLGYFFAILSG